MHRIQRLLVAVAVLSLAACGGDDDSLPEILRSVECVRTTTDNPLGSPDFWNSAIESFEQRDAKNPPEPGSIVFIGSSSITFWGTVAEDMKPLPAVNRGFGGSIMVQSTGYVPRIVLPYRPRAVVLYEGDNDIAFGVSADCVLEDYDAFVAAVYGEQPDVPIYFLSIKPSVARAELWPVMQRANDLVKARASRDSRLHYIDVATPLLDENGGARPELFVADGLHLNPDGYAIWTSIVRPILLADLG